MITFKWTTAIYGDSHSCSVLRGAMTLSVHTKIGVRGEAKKEYPYKIGIGDRDIGSSANVDAGKRHAEKEFLKLIKEVNHA